MTDPAIKENLIIGIKFQLKFQLFFMGLIFGVLAISIQTANLQNSWLANFWEVSGWAFMLLAGICGLSCAQFVPQIYNMNSMIIKYATSDNEEIKELAEKIKKSTDRKTQILIKAESVFFLVGIISLAFSRAFSFLFGQ